ncbi:MAG TPA: hypothetical protein PLA90_05065 [Candidatus Sumerlaeota bacterium]|nr:hypothetical protein [Candidatus Sumerlaeota bacterium]HPS00893.1 hypothetical protein [Candidatus Sumerlaeota bacterium]
MTPLTRCKRIKPRPSRHLRVALLLRTFSLLVVLAGLAAVQIHLRFRTGDLRIETRKLQESRDKLSNMRVGLVSEVERLKCYNLKFREASQELGLRECHPDSSSRVVVSASVIEKWSGWSAEPADEPQEEQDSSIRKAAELGERVLSWSTPSMAREPRVRKKN